MDLKDKESKAGVKTHIGCSRTAYMSIIEDYNRFNPGGRPLSKDAFLNKLIFRCHNDLYVKNIIDTIKKNKKNENYQAINDFLFLGTVTRSDKANASFYLYKTTLASIHLLDTDPESREVLEINEAFGSIGRYINTLFDIYAGLPYLFRERVVVGDTLSLIQSAVNSGAMVVAQTVKLSSDSTPRYTDQKFLPYRVCADSMGMYLYVCGMDIRESTEENHHTNPVSFRIARLYNVRVEPAPFKLSKENTQQLEERIISCGAQYVTSTAITVRLILNNKGKDLYARKLFNRPAITYIGEYEPDPSYSLYECTGVKYQIESYFNSSFDGAVVLDPKLGRDISKAMIHGAERYQKYLEPNDPSL